jgi:Flp pilus assembly protein TadG
MRDRLRSAVRAGRDESAQSLVEIALVLPILLMLVIGVVDVGRVLAYKITTTSAAREAAFLGARDAQSATDGADGICQRARDAFGAPVVPSPCTTAPITVVCTRGGVACGAAPAVPALYQTNGAGAADVSVTVTYQLQLLTGFLVGRAFAVNPVPIGATVSFGGLGQ